ncbi:MAG: hypothetical protein J6I69_03915 [Bacilli bacterium]|nr:hypothetical protein [Bacilli bacterium]
MFTIGVLDIVFLKATLKDDKNNYDMTFSHNYSPDFYLRGDFTANNGKIIIDDLYKSTTDIKDTIWSYGEHIAG